MKKYILIFISTVFFVSCDIGDDNYPSSNFYLEVMPIESVDIPSEFTFGETYEISMSYTRPNGCYEFNNFIYDADGNTRNVAIIDTVYSDISCTQATEQATVSFDFRVISTETYIFRFYQGNVGGEDQYLIIEVPVIE